MRLSAHGGVAPPKRGTLIHIFEIALSGLKSFFWEVQKNKGAKTRQKSQNQNFG
jgi:hypothetical protein